METVTTPGLAAEEVGRRDGGEQAWGFAACWSRDLSRGNRGTRNRSARRPREIRISQSQAELPLFHMVSLYRRYKTCQ